MTTIAPQSISYNALLTKVQSETENLSTELLGEFPQIVRDAELMLLRVLDIQNLHVYADGNFSSTQVGTNQPVTAIGQTAYVALPSDSEVVRWFAWYTPAGLGPSQDNVTDQNSGTINLLQRVDETFLQIYWPNKSQTGMPKYYAVLGTVKNQASPPGQILVAPTPQTNYALRIGYTTRGGSLVDLDPITGATYLSTWYPDLLFYGCMVRCGAFMKAMDQLQIWETLFQSSLQSSLKLEARKKGQVYADTSSSTIPLEQRQR